jgi:hypothetical protein
MTLPVFTSGPPTVGERWRVSPGRRGSAGRRVATGAPVGDTATAGGSDSLFGLLVATLSSFDVTAAEDLSELVWEAAGGLSGEHGLEAVGRAASLAAGRYRG